MIRKYALDEGQRQATLLAIAKLSRERPGWDYMLGEVAEALDGRAMYEEFKVIHQTPPIGDVPWPTTEGR